MSVRNMDVQDFIALNVKRRLAATFGEDDPAPGMPWSAAFNDPIFILALEKVKPDEWNNSCNERCWTHLHIGSEEPNWSSSSVRSCPKAADAAPAQ